MTADARYAELIEAFPEFATKKTNHDKEKRGKSKVFLAFFARML